MRAIRWIFLPVIVIGCAAGTFALFYRIDAYIVDACAARYALDIPICPEPWAPPVLSVLFCIGSIVAGVLCLIAAYIVAPSARHRVVRITALVLACLTLYMLFIHRRWELLFALVAAFAADFFIRKHALRSTPNT